MDDLEGRVHGQHRHADIQHRDAAVGHILGDGAAAASLCAVSADPSGASVSGAVSASAAVLSAASEAAAEEALSLAPATVVVPLSCWAALTARWTCGSVVGV